MTIAAADAAPTESVPKPAKSVPADAEPFVTVALEITAVPIPSLDPGNRCMGIPGLLAAITLDNMVLPVPENTVTPSPPLKAIARPSEGAAPPIRVDWPAIATPSDLFPTCSGDGPEKAIPIPFP